MKIAIFGAPGSGKSTLSRILHGALPSRHSLVSGDDFIFQDGNDSGLASALRTDDLIFEHLSAWEILHREGISSDVAIMMRCTGDQVAARRPQLSRAAIAQRVNSADRQLDKAKQNGCQIIEALGINDALRQLTSHLRFMSELDRPTDTFALKVATRCNLSCSYCYMYEGFDRDWELSPRFISAQIVSAAARRIREYCAAHQLSTATIVLHGGEPLLLGLDRFQTIMDSLLSQFGDEIFVKFAIQTNAVLLTEKWLSALDHYGFQIGVSLDGVGEANDRRKTTRGRKSDTDVANKIRLIREFNFKKGSFAGVLAVVNPTANGSEVYRTLRHLDVDSLDFLLPDLAGKNTNGAEGNYLRSAFDEWLRDDKPCSVRIFSSAISLLSDVKRSSDAIGLMPIRFLAVNAVGGWEFLDILRTTEEGLWKSPFNVFDHDLEMVLQSERHRMIDRWKYDLSENCIECKFVTSCGGGYLPHRFRKQTEFRNPSSHCASLYEFFEHVSSTLQRYSGDY